MPEQEVRYNKIGVGYNQTRKADPYLTERLTWLLSPTPNGIYLDIGCGTGNYTRAIAKNEFAFIGVEPSTEMLDKAKAIESSIEWQLGTAEDTKLESESIDGILATFTLHHWTDLNNGFAEMQRVLKPGGSMVILTSEPGQTARYWLAEYFPNMIADSVKWLPSLNNIVEAAQDAGFGTYKTEIYNVQPDLRDLFLYAGKHNPAIYLRPEVRKGISSFSVLSNAAEVEEGLKKLEADIETGRIKQVMASYEHDEGDYLFVKIEKPSTD